MNTNSRLDSTMTSIDVEVYRNLHQQCWSIRHKGLVVAHADYVELANVTCHVGQAGRTRVITEGRKNVHATLRGTLVRWQAAASTPGGWGLRFEACRAANCTTVLLERRTSVAVAPSWRRDLVSLSYNPYRNPEQPGAFYRTDYGMDVHGAEGVAMHAKGVAAWEVDDRTPAERLQAA